MIGDRRAQRNASFGSVAMGVDPGLAHCGFAVVTEDARGVMTVAHTEMVETAKAPKYLDLRTADDDARRLLLIQRATVRILCDRSPAVIGLETYAPRPGLQGNGAFKVAMVYGLIFGLAASANRPVHAFSPLDLRLALLGGRAGTKEEIQAALEARVPDFRKALSKYPKGKQEHIADAIGHAVLALDTTRLERRLQNLKRQG